MESWLWIVVVLSALWVYIDANNIGVRKGLIPGMFNMGPGGWCLATLLLWIIGFPAYLIKRSSLKAAANAASGMTASSLSGGNATPANPRPFQGSNLADLEKLAELKGKGIITDSEFEQKKKELLGF